MAGIQKIIAGFFVILCFSTCQSIQSILQEPKVSVRSVDFKDINFNGVDLICRLDVENPNVFEIPFPDVDWELYINNASFIRGTLNSNTKLAGRGTVTVDVPFSVNYAGLYNTFSSLWNTSEAAYSVALGVRFPLPLLDNKTFHLAHNGNIPLFQIPKIHVGSFRIAKLDFTGIEMDWNLAVENPNSFTIPFPNIDWEYAVNEQALIRSSLNETGNIPAQSQSPLNIKLNVLYTDIIAALGSLGNASEVLSMMKMDTSFPIPSLENLKNILEMPATIPILQIPELRFSGISIKNLGLQRFDFAVDWEVVNKNNFSLDISQFVYDLTVNNSSWAQGTIVNPPQIKANAATLIPLDISITSLPLITQIIDIMNRGGGVDYKSLGNLSLSSDFYGLEGFDLPFDLSGTTRLVRN